MSAKHLLTISSFLILISVIDQTQGEYSKSVLQEIDRRTKYAVCQHECNRVKCNVWVNPENCLLMKGKYIKQSITENDCNCCAYCVIENGFFESCHNYVPGFQINCVSNSVCSKQDGFICKPIKDLDNYKKQLKKHKKYTKTLANDKNAYYEAVAKKMIKSVPEHQRPLKRVPRTPYKVGIRFGSKKANGETVTGDSVDGPLVEQRKKINAISGGNANSINSNIGPTFIINNNYRYMANQAVVGQSIKMSKEGNLIYETKPNANSCNATQSTLQPPMSILPLENEMVASSQTQSQSSVQSSISGSTISPSLSTQENLLGKLNVVSSSSSTNSSLLVPALSPIDNSINNIPSQSQWINMFPNNTMDASNIPVLSPLPPLAPFGSPLEPLQPLQALNCAPTTTPQVCTSVSTGKPKVIKLVEFEYRMNMWRKISENNNTCTGYPTDAELNALFAKDPTPVNGDRAILEEEEDI